MEYQNIDEATRREAYERVKQIAEAIKKIRKKYYLCFNRISDIDKQRYDALKAQMQSIASENGLEKSSTQLINEIEIQYNRVISNGKDENGNTSSDSMNKNYKRYLAAVQLLAEQNIKFYKTLNKVHLERAIEIQNYIKKLVVVLEEYYGKEKLSFEKSRILNQKFSEHTMESINGLAESCYKSTATDMSEKRNIDEIINEYMERESSNEGKTMEYR